MSDVYVAFEIPFSGCIEKHADVRVNDRPQNSETAQLSCSVWNKFYEKNNSALTFQFIDLLAVMDRYWMEMSILLLDVSF